MVFVIIKLHLPHRKVYTVHTYTVYTREKNERLVCIDNKFVQYNFSNFNVIVTVNYCDTRKGYAFSCSFFSNPVGP